MVLGICHSLGCMSDLRKVGVGFVVGFLLLVTFLFFHRSQGEGERAGSMYEGQVASLAESEEWVRIRDLRAYCNGHYDSDVERVRASF